MFDFIKRLVGIKKEKERTIIPNFRHTPPPRSRRILETPVRESSMLRRVYDEPKKDDSVDLLTTMIIADALLSDTSNDSDSNHSGTGVLDGGFGGGDYSGGGSGGSWDDSSSSSDYSSSSDSSYDSSSSYDSGSSSSDW